jgi:hypothetical protein
MTGSQVAKRASVLALLALGMGGYSLMKAERLCEQNEQSFCAGYCYAWEEAYDGCYWTNSNIMYCCCSTGCYQI